MSRSKIQPPELSSIPWAKRKQKKTTTQVPWNNSTSSQHSPQKAPWLATRQKIKTSLPQTQTQTQTSPPISTANTKPTPNKLEIGQQTEQEALHYLQQQGLQLHRNNYRCRCGELDLIMHAHGTAIIVEVRHRSHHSHGHAAHTIDWHKQRKINRCALRWWTLEGQYLFHSLRFDVITQDHHQPLQWIQNAWQLPS